MVTIDVESGASKVQLASLNTDGHETYYVYLPRRISRALHLKKGDVLSYNCWKCDFPTEIVKGKDNTSFYNSPGNALTEQELTFLDQYKQNKRNDNSVVLKYMLNQAKLNFGKTRLNYLIKKAEEEGMSEKNEETEHIVEKND